MRIAVLILAFRYPRGLRALARYFSGPDHRVFVHVDAKVGIEPFIAAAGDGVSFVADRVTVFWRGWTMVEATMKLILAARAEGPFDQFVLLSDDALPLLDVGGFRAALAAAPHYLDVGSNRARAERYDKFFMYDSDATQTRYVPSRAVSDDAMARMARMIALRLRGKKPVERHFQGSQWWGLPAASIETLVARWHDDPWLRESFEFSDAPDESYFQEILGPTHARGSRKLMAVDWKAPTPPRLYVQAAELAALTPTTELFVRKIDFDDAELDVWLERIGASVQG